MAGLLAMAVVEVRADPDRVWQALTDPEWVERYFMGARVESNYRPGGTITWSGVWQGRAYQDKGNVLKVEPGRVLEVTHYSALAGDDDVPGTYDRLRFELEPNGSSTRVRLTQDGCETPEQVDEFSRTWQSVLEGCKTVAEQQ